MISAIAGDDLLIKVKSFLLEVDVGPVGAIVLLGVERLFFTFHSCRSEPKADLISNSGLSIGQSLRLVLCRRMEVDTMAASIAVDVLSLHRALSGMWMPKLPHGGKLPRVLSSIEEEDVVAADVQATVKGVGPVSASVHILAEDSLAVVRPKVEGQSLSTHRLLLVWRLEEAKLVAILVGPLAEI